MTKQGKAYELFPHQKEGLKRALKEPFYSLFMEQGTGKTAIAIKAIEERYKRGLISRVVIFTPNSILFNWELEIKKFLGLPGNQYIIERLNHKRKDRRIQLYNDFLRNDPTKLTLKQLKAMGYKGTKSEIVSQMKPKLMILLVNYEKSRVMFKQFKKFNPHMLVVDESHKLKNREAKISKSIYSLTRGSSYRLIMTGTPVCNGYEDLFMQYKIVDESVFGKDYKSFESTYIIKGGYGGYDIVGYRNEDDLKETVKATSYRVRIDECVKLPPLITKPLFCELNPKARKAYEEMNKDMITQMEETSERITRKELKAICKENGVDYSPRETYQSLFIKASSFLNTSSCDLLITKLMRLQQIAGGFLTLDSGEIHSISKDKLALVKEVVSESTEPVIIFCQYVPEIDMLTAELSTMKRDKKLLKVDSYRDPKRRDQVYRSFQKGELDILILQLSSGSVGLNLQRANKLILYSWSFSSVDYVQAISRIKRQGQKKAMMVIPIIAEDTVDIEILQAIKQKRVLSDRLLD